MTASEKRKESLGRVIADVLKLKANTDNRYNTEWGTKTLIGLGACALRWVEENGYEVKIKQ